MIKGQDILRFLQVILYSYYNSQTNFLLTSRYLSNTLKISGLHDKRQLVASYCTPYKRPKKMSSTACGQTVDIDSSLSACFIAANSTQPVQQIFSTCCSQVHSTTVTSSDGCFISCSATDGTLSTCFGNGLMNESSINPFLVDDACYGAASGGLSTTGSSSPVSGSAIPSSTPASTSSTTATPTTATPTTAASSDASTTGSASGFASPSASKTAKAARGVSLSYGAMAMLGLSICGFLA